MINAQQAAVHNSASNPNYLTSDLERRQIAAMNLIQAARLGFEAGMTTEDIAFTVSMAVDSIEKNLTEEIRK